MRIEYDHDKAVQNLVKHRLLFDGVFLLDWDHALIWQDCRKDYGERRMNALADLYGRLYAVVFVFKGSDTLRVISFRKANKRERKKFDEQKKAGI